MKYKQELAELSKRPHPDKERQQALVQAKKQASQELASMIARNDGITRRVNPRLVCDYRSFIDGKPPDRISWDNLKLSKKICEFASEQSRAMGVEPDEVTLDKIVLSWRSIDILRQIVLYGFDMVVPDARGQPVVKHFHFQTASAGQIGL